MKENLNIYQKLAAITAELQIVGKNLTVGYGKNQYKAVSERDIIDAVKPLESKYGIYSFPCDRRVIESRILESEKRTKDQSGNETTTTSTTFMTRIETTYMFVNTDNPEEHVETVTFAEGIDTQDKGSGKAMTYADKYALMKMYKISTGDDPDQYASEPTAYKSAQDEPFSPSYRDKLIAHCKQSGKNMAEISVKYGLNKDSAQDAFKKAYESEAK